MSIFNSNKRTRTASKKNYNQITVIICLSIVLVLGLVLFVRYNFYVQAQKETEVKLAESQKREALFFQQTFYEGVSVEGIDLSNKTKEEAKEVLSDQLKDKFESPEITVKYKDKSWVFDEKHFTTTIDVEGALSNAWKVGRSGDDQQRLDEINKAKNEGINKPATVVQNPEFIYNELKNIKTQTDQPMIPASVTLKYDSAPQFIYTDEQVGTNLDVDAAYREICEQLKISSKFTYALKPEEIQPTIKRSDIEKNYVLISSFSTYIGDSQPARKTNVTLALKVFDQKTLMPGETLSFNQWVGERTADKGYQMAVFINSDQVYDEAAGGGICQTSTTLYNAALLAGANMRGRNAPIEIVERYPHSWPSVYIDKGRDASVNWPYADLKMRNNKSTPLFFHTFNANNRIYVEIYGEPLPNNAKVSIETQLVDQKPAPALVELKDTSGKYKLAPGQKKKVSDSRPGYTVSTYQIWTEDGKEPIKTLINTTVYQPIPGKIYVGVG